MVILWIILGGDIAWLYQDKSYQLDIDNDGLADSAFKIDQAWSQGIENVFNEIRRKRASHFIMVGNKGSLEFNDLLNGKFFEAWPNDYLGSKENWGWNQCMENAMKMEYLGAKYIFFQVANPAYLEFAVASALLLDNVYVVVGQDNDKMYPILKTKIGKPLGPFIEADYVYYRDYEHGSVEVRPSDRWARINIFEDLYSSTDTN
ncbi:hypothetical protein JXK06_03490 [Patescibacteria group bacterium]|nr:hypothetical protein [Patescibacteria group bacterium]